MLHFARFVIAILFAALLAGCGSPVRTFNPETDTGYQVTEEEKANYYSKQDAFDDSSNLGHYAWAFFGGMASGAVAIVFPPAMFVTSLASGYLGGKTKIRAYMEQCMEERCMGHQPFGDILVSGNVMRGVVFRSHLKDDEYNLFRNRDIDLTIYDNPEYEEELQNFLKSMYADRVFKQPIGLVNIEFPVDPVVWSPDALFDNKKISLRRGYLVDVYFPHMPEVERDALLNRKIYSGLVVHIVCEDGDGGCRSIRKARTTSYWVAGKP